MTPEKKLQLQEDSYDRIEHYLRLRYQVWSLKRMINHINGINYFAAEEQGEVKMSFELLVGQSQLQTDPGINWLLDPGHVVLSGDDFAKMTEYMQQCFIAFRLQKQQE